MIRAAAKVWFECLLICYWYYQTQHLLARLQICNMSGLSKLAMFCSLIICCWSLCHDQKNNKDLKITWCASGPIIYGRFLIDMTIKLLMIVHQGSGWKALSCNSKFGSVSEDIEAFYECILLCCLLLTGWVRQKFCRLVGPVTYNISKSYLLPIGIVLWNSMPFAKPICYFPSILGSMFNVSKVLYNGAYHCNVQILLF
jgi:hypothetical protein